MKRNLLWIICTPWIYFRWFQHLIIRMELMVLKSKYFIPDVLQRKTKLLLILRGYDKNKFVIDVAQWVMLKHIEYEIDTNKSPDSTFLKVIEAHPLWQVSTVRAMDISIRVNVIWFHKEELVNSTKGERDMKSTSIVALWAEIAKMWLDKFITVIGSVIGICFCCLLWIARPVLMVFRWVLTLPIVIVHKGLEPFKWYQWCVLCTYRQHLNRDLPPLTEAAFRRYVQTMGLNEHERDTSRIILSLVRGINDADHCINLEDKHGVMNTRVKLAQEGLDCPKFMQDRFALMVHYGILKIVTWHPRYEFIQQGAMKSVTRPQSSDYVAIYGESFKGYHGAAYAKWYEGFREGRVKIEVADWDKFVKDCSSGIILPDCIALGTKFSDGAGELGGYHSIMNALKLPWKLSPRHNLILSNDDVYQLLGLIDPQND